MFTIIFVFIMKLPQKCFTNLQNVILVLFMYYSICYYYGLGFILIFSVLFLILVKVLVTLCALSFLCSFIFISVLMLVILMLKQTYKLVFHLPRQHLNEVFHLIFIFYFISALFKLLKILIIGFSFFLVINLEIFI